MHVSLEWAKPYWPFVLGWILWFAGTTFNALSRKTDAEWKAMEAESPRLHALMRMSRYVFSDLRPAMRALGDFFLARSAAVRPGAFYPAVRDAASLASDRQTVERVVRGELTPKQGYALLSDAAPAPVVRELPDPPPPSLGALPGLYGPSPAWGLIFAAHQRCLCGAGMAYRAGAGTNGSWWCSSVLLGAAQSPRHTAPLPFAEHDVLSEVQPSANGATTRPPIPPPPDTQPATPGAIGGDP